jgi:hypothetical protein
VGKKTLARATVLGALCLPVLPALAQDAGGLLLSFGIDQRLESGNNLTLETPEEGNSSIATTFLSFGLLSETATQQIGFDLGGGLQIQNTPSTEGTETSFADPSVSFFYNLEGANSTLNLSANYSEADIDTLTLSDFINNEGLIELPEDFASLSGTGQRSDYGVSALLETGLDAPLGFVLSGGAGGIDYTGTNDPTLFDIARSNAEATALLRFSPVTTGTLGLNYSTYDADDDVQTYTTTTGADAGVIYSLSSRATVEATIGYTEVQTEELGQATTTTSNPVGSLGIVYDMPNGAATADFDATTDDDGNERLNLVFGRSMDLPDGALAYTFGLTDPEAGDVAPIGSLTWERALPDGQVSASLQRSVTSSNADESRLSTLIAFAYDRTINDVSGIGFDLIYGQTDATATENDVSQIDLTAAYNYALTPDWSLNTGIVYQVRNEDSVGRSESPSVFLSIGRRFDFRP